MYCIDQFYAWRIMGSTYEYVAEEAHFIGLYVTGTLMIERGNAVELQPISR